LIPLIRGIPWLYSWRNRRKFYRWYGELKKLELEIIASPATEKLMDYQGRLDQIEAMLNKVRVPLTFFGEVYRLKEHVELVRGKLARPNHQTKQCNS
jgi:phosphoenolpyruvate carboxylase